MKAKVLIIDDEISMLEWMKIALENKYEVLTINKPENFIEIVESEKPDIIVTDIRMPGLTGFDILEILNRKNLGIPCILMTAYASIDSVIEAMRKGAKDYLVKPFSEEELVFRIEKYLPFKKEVKEFIAEDEKTLKIRELAEKAAKTDVPVFIYGESGV